MTIVTRLAAILAFALAIQTTPASAQDFPDRLVRIVVPYPAGGGVDGMARSLGESLSQIWKQPVIIENKPGASTMIGGEFVARAPADGYTLLLTSDSSITSNPFLFPNAKFDPVKDLAPITQLIELNQLVVLHPSVPANSLKELVALSKEKKGALNYGSYGVGSQPHLLFEMLRAQGGAEIMQIPYRGIAPAITATIAGDVQMTLGGWSVTAGHIKAGKLKAIAISKKERQKELPDVPTLKEAGFPDIDPQSWFGLFAPAGTPKAIIEKIQKDVAEVFKEPAFQKRLETLAFEPVASTSDAFAKFIAEDLAYKGKLIAATGIKAE
ncbi:MAG: Bug family tripartite tricarboxylate transporter substrate binding protein [Pseudorhodoplanes sp.]